MTVDSLLRLTHGPPQKEDPMSANALIVVLVIIIFLLVFYIENTRKFDKKDLP